MNNKTNYQLSEKQLDGIVGGMIGLFGKVITDPNKLLQLVIREYDLFQQKKEELTRLGQWDQECIRVGVTSFFVNRMKSLLILINDEGYNASQYYKSVAYNDRLGTEREMKLGEAGNLYSEFQEAWRQARQLFNQTKAEIV